MSRDQDKGQSDASMKDVQDDEIIERLSRELARIGMGVTPPQMRNLWNGGHRTLDQAMDAINDGQHLKVQRPPTEVKRPPMGPISIPRAKGKPPPIRSPDQGSRAAPTDDCDQKDSGVTQPAVPGKKKKRHRKRAKGDPSQLKKGNCMRYIKKKKILAETLYGCVRKGTDRVTGHTIIIKESRKDLVKKGLSTKGVKVREDIRKEIQIHGFLSTPASHGVRLDPCPFILQNIDVCQDPNYIYQILEVCPGDLFDHVVKLHDDCMGSREWREASRLPDAKKKTEERRLFRRGVEVHVRRLFRQVIEGVKYMHKLCVCHLDLSLENVLVGMDGMSRICDFGLAAYCGAKVHKQPEERFHIKGCFGKRGYMAPEMMQSQRCDGRKADMWSCAVILFCMLLNSPPYDVPNITDFKFKLLWEGHVADYLRRCGRAHLFSDEAVQVMQALFRPEATRLLPKALLELPFFQTDNNTANNDSLATFWTYDGVRITFARSPDVSKR